MNHEQVWIKTNTPVDAGIADLVSALNDFPGVRTIESCQGTASEPAWVAFWYGSHWEYTWEELSGFVFGRLAPWLMEKLGSRITLQVTAKESGGVQGELTVMPGAVQPTTEALRQLLQNSAQERGRP